MASAASFAPLRVGEPLLAITRRLVWTNSEACDWFEESAQAWAITEFFERRRRMLCWVPPDLSHQHRWPYFNEQWRGLSVAVFSEGSYDDKPSVGVCLGIGPDFLGPALTVAHFGHFGITTHISPLGVLDIFELPPELTEPPGRWDDEDDSGDDLW